MGLTESDGGLCFYNFDEISGSLTNFKQLYRQRLNMAPVDKAKADRMVDEANIAFDLNTRLFHHLDKLAGFDKVRAVHSFIKQIVPIIIIHPQYSFMR